MIAASGLRNDVTILRSASSNCTRVFYLGFFANADCSIDM